MNPISTDTIQSLIIEVRGERVLLDSDVARVYGVHTRDINKAVSNNPDKFPSGYMLTLGKEDKRELVENFHQFNRLKHSPVLPKAFSERGLYMLATILKSAKATQATFAIIDHRRRGMRGGACRRQPEGRDEPGRERGKPSWRFLMTTYRQATRTTDATSLRGGACLWQPERRDERRRTRQTSIELNFAVLKFKHTVKRKK